jgi:pilus assembly protein Flp/PilA
LFSSFFDSKGYDLVSSALACTCREFLEREDGPTAVEYAVMLALIIAVCIGAITTLGTNANTTFGSVGGAVNVGS